MVLLKLVCGGCEEIMLVKVFESVAETSFDKRMSQEEVSYAEVINWSEMVVTKFTPTKIGLMFLAARQRTADCPEIAPG